MDLLEEIQKQLKKRQWGEAIRLEIESNVDKRLLKILKKGAFHQQSGYLPHPWAIRSDLPYENVWSGRL